MEISVWAGCSVFRIRTVVMVVLPGIGDSGGRTWVGLEKLQAEL